MGKYQSIQGDVAVDELDYGNSTLQPKNHNEVHTSEDEVDIWDLVRIIWDGRIYIFLSAILFLGFAIFHISNGPTEYSSNAVLLQETAREASGSQRLMQNFGLPFGLASGNISESGRIPASLYPTIISSANFRFDIIFEDIEFSRFEEPMSLYEYFNDHYQAPKRDAVYSFIRQYTIQFPFRVFDWIINFSLFEPEEEETEEEIIIEIDDRLLSLSRGESRVFSQLDGRISLSIDGNLITVNTTMPDRKAAAMLNVMVIEKIKEYVTNYQTEKAHQSLSYIRQQKEQAKERYEEAQNDLALFRDQNVILSTNVARTEDERLVNQRNVTFNIYNSLAVELEQAQLRVQEETPVFSIFQKPSLPTLSLGGSNRIVVASLFLGAFFGLAFVFGVKIYEKVEEEIVQRNS